MNRLWVTVDFDKRGVAKLSRAIVDAHKLEKQIGAMIVSDAQNAFQLQRFGDFDWPEKYPGQSDPFISVAGAIQDFSEGRTKPRSETFERRPALHRTSELRNSIAMTPVGGGMQIGSALPYATLHQQGGTSVQQIDQATRERILKWLVKEKRKVIEVPGGVSDDEFAAFARSKGYRVVAKKPKKGAKDTRTNREKMWGKNRRAVTLTIESPYIKKLLFATKPATTSLTTKVHARPFIGILERTAEDISVLIAEHVQKRGMS